MKDDTAEHYQDQLDIYNLLLRKNGYETEDLMILEEKEVFEKFGKTGRGTYHTLRGTKGVKGAFNGR